MLPPETRLMVACVRPVIEPEQVAQIAERCRGPIDWQQFLRLLDRHYVGPLVWRSLKRVANNGIPANVVNALKGRRRAGESVLIGGAGWR